MLKSTHMGMLKSEHTKEDIYEKHGLCEKVSIHTGDSQVYTTYLNCIHLRVRACVCVCVGIHGRVFQQRLQCLGAFWELCDIPHGRQKDNVAGKQRVRRKWKNRANGRGREPGELSVNFLKVLHLVSHYFHQSCKEHFASQRSLSRLYACLSASLFFQNASQCLSCLFFKD